MTELTLREVLRRLRRSYPGIGQGQDLDTKLVAIDLIIVMKTAGKSKDDFLRRMDELWDDIQMEPLQ